LLLLLALLCRFFCGATRGKLTSLILADGAVRILLISSKLFQSPTVQQTLHCAENMHVAALQIGMAKTYPALANPGETNGHRLHDARHGTFKSPPTPCEHEHLVLEFQFRPSTKNVGSPFSIILAYSVSILAAPRLAVRSGITDGCTLLLV
jgi:hypothetical protein